MLNTSFRESEAPIKEVKEVRIEEKLRKSSARVRKPEIPPVLKQWLDFKPNNDPNNPNKREPSEHEKSKYYQL